MVNLADVVRSLGCDPEIVFREAGFETQEFLNSENQLNYVRTSHLLEHCVKATGCGYLGLILGFKAEPADLGIAGELVSAAPTVQVALEALVQNLNLHDQGGSAFFETGRHYSSLGFGVNLQGVKAVEVVYDLSAVFIYKIMRAICGERWVGATVNLPRSTPENAEIYKGYFCATVYFNSTECYVTFPNVYLDAQPPTADEFLFRLLTQKARELQALTEADLMVSLPTVLRKGVLSKQFSAPEIASAFGMHERTFHRRLRDAGTGFRQELDLVRQALGEQLLGSTSLPVCEVADVLGYANSSCFIRAFQRWNGLGPTDWRNQSSQKRGRVVVEGRQAIRTTT